MPNGSKSSLDSLLNLYGAKGSGTMQGVNAFLRDKAPGMLESLLPSDGGLPGYEDIYSSFGNVVQRDLNKRLAGLKETYGSRGALYSSDLARQAAQARTEATDRIIAGASTLRQNRMSELLGLGGFTLEAIGAGRQDRDRALSLLLTDYLTQTKLPDAMSGFADFAINLSSAGQPTTAIY